jgi:hypothetical protein
MRIEDNQDVPPLTAKQYPHTGAWHASSNLATHPAVYALRRVDGHVHFLNLHPSSCIIHPEVLYCCRFIFPPISSPASLCSRYPSLPETR